MQVTSGVYSIKTGGFNSVNTYLITAEKLTLIDTGFGKSFENIIEFIHKLGRSEQELNLIVITHNHPDHTGSMLKLKILTEAKIAAHKDDIDSPPFSKFTGRVLRNLYSVGIGKRMFLRLGDVDIKLAGGEVLPVAGGLEVIHTPGHTPGGISLYLTRDKILFSGDLINTRYDQPRIPYQIINYITNWIKESLG